MGMGNLQKKVYSDRRTGVKRRWMEYWKVNRWLKVRDKTTDEHASIHKRIAQVERWVWIFFGGITVVGALLGKGPVAALF